MPPRLTLEELEQALALRVEGKTYADVAEHFGVTNDHNLRTQIKDYMGEGLARLSLNFELVLALDLARTERMLAPMMEEAIESKSTRHVDAAVKLMRTKMDLMKFAAELQKETEDTDDAGTFKTTDDLYNEALDIANAAILEGDWEPDVDEIDMGDDLDPEERQLLETQLHDLDSTIELADQVNDGRSEDF